MKKKDWEDAVRVDGEERRQRKALEQVVDEYVARHLPRLLSLHGPQVPAQQLGVLVIRVEGPATTEQRTDRVEFLSDEVQLGGNNGANGKGGK